MQHNSIEQQATGNVTKRQLGLAFVVVGILGFVGILALDILRHKANAIGPAQVFALVGCVGVVILGLTLIPLGDHPA